MMVRFFPGSRWAHRFCDPARGRRITTALTMLPSLLVALAAPAAAAHTIGDTWQEVAIRGVNPFPRDNFAAAPGSDPELASGYIFGGSVDDFKRGPTFFDSLLEWKVTVTEDAPVATFTVLGQRSTTKPSPRAFPVIGVVGQGADAMVYVFGGGVHDRALTLTTARDKFWRYDPRSGQWQDLSDLGGPSPRSGAVMVVWQDHLFVFGGVVEGQDPAGPKYLTRNDLWDFHTRAMAWSLLSDGAGPKHKRMAMGGRVGSDGDGQLLIYGGEPLDGARLVFPIDTETWTWAIARGGWARKADGPVRNMALIGTNTGGALVFGGDKEGGSSGCGAPYDQDVVNDLFYYDLERDAWDRMAGIANVPAPTKRAAGVWTAGHFYVFGGFDFVCDSDADPGQIWNETVYRIRFEE